MNQNYLEYTSKIVLEGSSILPTPPLPQISRTLFWLKKIPVEN